MDLPQRLADFQTLAEGLDYAAQGNAALRFHTSRGEIAETLSYTSLRLRAMATGRRLTGIGLERGSRVGVIASTDADFLSVFYGCQYAGILACPLPFTLYMGGRQPYVDRLARLLLSAGAACVVSTQNVLPLVREAASMAGVGTVLSHAELADRQADGALEPLAAGEDAYIQYSSGSTSEPKGVLISQRAVLANAGGILREVIRLSAGDRSFSWLPFYHDMGLVGFSIAPMLGQSPVDYLPASAFARNPGLWLRLMSQYASTITYAPGFGYELAARHLKDEEVPLDLSRLRVAGIGGDMIRIDILQGFARRFAKAGFREAAFLPSYGMAEATLGIAFAKGLAVDGVDRAGLGQGGKSQATSSPDAREFVICGRPLGGHDILIEDENGCAADERAVGRILFRGASLMRGYFGAPGETSPARPDGFFDTGDLGYRIGTDLVVTGRSKDLILHHGRNIWPQDVERVAERIPPLRPGHAAAFATEEADGREVLTVLIECGLGEEAERCRLRWQVEVAIAESQGLTAQVVLVAPGSLPYTSSGKLARSQARRLFLSGQLSTTGLKA